MYLTNLASHYGNISKRKSLKCTVPYKTVKICYTFTPIIKYNVRRNNVQVMFILSKIILLKASTTPWPQSSGICTYIFIYGTYVILLSAHSEVN